MRERFPTDRHIRGRHCGYTAGRSPHILHLQTRTRHAPRRQQRRHLVPLRRSCGAAGGVRRRRQCLHDFTVNGEPAAGVASLTSLETYGGEPSSLPIRARRAHRHHQVQRRGNQSTTTSRFAASPHSLRRSPPIIPRSGHDRHRRVQTNA